MAITLKYFNETMIRKTLALMKPNNQLFEIRIIGGGKPLSGYFTDVNKLIDELDTLNLKGKNVYITLGGISNACYSRTQRDCFKQFSEATTNDNDIVGYEWLMVDLDPKRSTGTSSSDEELNESKVLCEKVYKFMEQVGFKKPLIAMSGNGYHLMYRIKLMNNKENMAIIEKCLKVLDMMFSNDIVKIDTVNKNPSRIAKLYGTVAQKGSNTKDRPHRMSYIFNDDTSIDVNDKAFLEKLCSYYPEELDKPQKYNSYNPTQFDLDEWIAKHGIRVKQKTSYSGGTKYVLDCCPFDSNHKNKDACLFKASNNAIGFHCFHNSCADKTWRDVRVLFEPDAYEKKAMEYEKNYYRKNREEPQKKVIEEKEGKPILYTANDIMNLPKVEESFIKTGITEIDKKLRGLKKGYVSVWSGCRASAKSTVLSNICLNAVDDGFNVAVYSGELTAQNFLKWLCLQACGKTRVEKGLYEGYYNVPIAIKKRITDWLGQHLLLYNNDYGNNYTAIYDVLEKAIEKNKLDLIVLDNLMAFNINGLADNKWDSQTQFVLSLQTLAKKHNVHICFVAHPRKAMGFLRLDDISGTGDLANAVDDAFIVHRVNNDFKRLSKQMFGWKDDNEIYEATNVIEIAKDRDGGYNDIFVPLYYEPETKRLKNSATENRLYGWDNDFTPINEELTPFTC